MTILVLPSWYPNENNEIAGSFFREQSLAMQKHGHEVIVLDGSFAPLNTIFSRQINKPLHFGMMRLQEN